MFNPTSRNASSGRASLSATSPLSAACLVHLLEYSISHQREIAQQKHEEDVEAPRKNRKREIEASSVTSCLRTFSTISPEARRQVERLFPDGCTWSPTGGAKVTLCRHLSQPPGPATVFPSFTDEERDFLYDQSLRPSTASNHHALWKEWLEVRAEGGGEAVLPVLAAMGWWVARECDPLSPSKGREEMPCGLKLSWVGAKRTKREAAANPNDERYSGVYSLLAESSGSFLEGASAFPLYLVGTLNLEQICFSTPTWASFARWCGGGASALRSFSATQCSVPSFSKHEIITNSSISFPQLQVLRFSHCSSEGFWNILETHLQLHCSPSPSPHDSKEKEEEKEQAATRAHCPTTTFIEGRRCPLECRLMPIRTLALDQCVISSKRFTSLLFQAIAHRNRIASQDEAMGQKGRAWCESLYTLELIFQKQLGESLLRSLIQQHQTFCLAHGGHPSFPEGTSLKEGTNDVLLEHALEALALPNCGIHSEALLVEWVRTLHEARLVYQRRLHEIQQQSRSLPQPLNPPQYQAPPLPSLAFGSDSAASLLTLSFLDCRWNSGIGDDFYLACEAARVQVEQMRIAGTGGTRRMADKIGRKVGP